MAQQSWTDPAYGVVFKPAHVDELQDAINAWESAYSITPTVFTDDEPTTATRIDALLFTEMQDALDALYQLTDASDFTWTTAAGYKFGDTAGVDGGDPLVEEVRDNMNFMQDQKCYQCDLCDTEGCTCDSACDSDGCDQCDTGCYGYSACSCNYTCYGEGCGCNGTCYGYVLCTCNVTCFGGYCPKQECGTCYNTNYGYVPCGCFATCYSESCGTCFNRCYSYSGCTCNSSCNNDLCDQCDATCHQESCSQCHVANYRYPWA